jgi:iron complex transport system permease protein
LLPLSVIYGGVFLVLADILARTILAPQISIGVVTAYLVRHSFYLYLAQVRTDL